MFIVNERLPVGIPSTHLVPGFRVPGPLNLRRRKRERTRVEGGWLRLVATALVLSLSFFSEYLSIWNPEPGTRNADTVTWQWRLEATSAGSRVPGSRSFKSSERKEERDPSLTHLGGFQGSGFQVL